MQGWMGFVIGTSIKVASGAPNQIKRKHRYTTWQAFSDAEAQAVFVKDTIDKVIEAVKASIPGVMVELTQTFRRSISKSAGVKPDTGREYESFGLVIKGGNEFITTTVAQQDEQLRTWVMRQITSGRTTELLDVFGVANLKQLELFLDSLAARKKPYFGLNFILDTDAKVSVLPVENINLVMKIDPKDSRSEHSPAVLFSGYPMQKMDTTHPDMEAMRQISQERIVQMTQAPQSKKNPPNKLVEMN
jgi:hypothetical protein